MALLGGIEINITARIQLTDIMTFGANYHFISIEKTLEEYMTELRAYTSSGIANNPIHKCLYNS